MASDDLGGQLAAAVEYLNRARSVCCLTGAGISAESGVPTFRGDAGFWAGRRAEELATPQAFADNPEEVWQFYLWRRNQLIAKLPNAGHHALAKIERLVPEFTLITQNVDDLHNLAGSENVIELHGNIWIDRCTACPQPDQRALNETTDRIPHCESCGAMLRPGIVWFGEMLPPEAISAAQDAATNCDVMLVIGTSALVQPAASLADWAQANGARVVEVNPDTTPLSPRVDLRFACQSGDILPRIADSLRIAR